MHTAANAAVRAPEIAGPDVAAAPVARYPPIVASLTAKSKAARQRRVEQWQATVHAAESVDEKLRILTKMQFLKYVVYPQTFALNADRWYQGFTKTVFLSGLPPPPGEPEPAPALDVEALRAAACDCLLQEHFYLRRKRRAPIYQEREAVASPFLDQLVASLVGLLSAHNLVLAAAALGKPRACRARRSRWGLGATVSQIWPLFVLFCQFFRSPLTPNWGQCGLIAVTARGIWKLSSRTRVNTGFSYLYCHLLT